MYSIWKNIQTNHNNLAFTKKMNIYLTYQKDKLICFAIDSILSISIHKYEENLINWYDTDKKNTVRYGHIQTLQHSCTTNIHYTSGTANENSM